MPNPGLGSVQLGTTWIETGIQPGNPERYKSRNVLRLGNSNVPYEEHNLYVPGKKKESLADKRLHTMLKTQLSNEIDIKKLNVVSFSKGELEKLDANQSGLIEYKRNIKTIVTDLFEERESANSDAVQEVKRIIDEKLLETLKLPLKSNSYFIPRKEIER